MKAVTVAEVQKLREEVEGLKDEVAHRKGSIAQLRKEQGDKGPEELREVLAGLEAEREAMEGQYRELLGKYRRLRESRRGEEGTE